MLQFITHQTPRFGIIEGAVAALNGGCKWIQLRMKGAPIEAVRQTAQQLIPLCKEHEAILVLDDYAQLAADLDIKASIWESSTCLFPKLVCLSARNTLSEERRIPLKTYKD